MITHNDIWDAIDEMAREQKISPSRLAINSGLNATTFNKSKRCDAFGKSRYPSFATIVKILNTANMSMTEFGIICDKNQNSKI
jgi:phage repressor protein C with HTH and peptisase S24 domain